MKTKLITIAFGLFGAAVLMMQCSNEYESVGAASRVAFIKVPSNVFQSDSQSKEKITPEKITPVRKGVMSYQEKERSKFFAQHKTGRKIDDLIATGTGELIITSLSPKPFITGNPHCPNYPRPYLRNIANEADAIIVGTVKDKISSQLTSNGEFIFSDYLITVQKILKANAPLQLGADITISRPGGAIELNNRIVRGRAGNFKPFQLNESYIVFLKYIPSTSSYVAFGNGSYHLRDSKVFSLLDAPGVSSDGDDATAMLNHINAAVSAGPCGKTPRLY